MLALRAEPTFWTVTVNAPACSLVRKLKNSKENAGSTSIMVTVAVDGNPMFSPGDAFCSVTVKVLFTA